MSIKIIEAPTLRWININQVDKETIRYLKEHFSFHHLDLEDIQGESQTPKIDVYQNYLFLILQFPHWQSGTETIISQEIEIFIGEGFLITIQRSQSKEIKNFFYRCMKNHNVKKDWMNNNSGYLLYRIIEALFSTGQPIINQLAKKISQVEEEIFQDQPDTGVIHELALLRRNILNFRRLLDPDRFLIGTLAHTRKPFLSEETSLYFDNVNDFLAKLWAIIDSYKETVQGLHITVESLINRRINKIISTLTVISVSLLPFTVLSSIYGMNIIGLPFTERPALVWAMFGVMTTIVIGIIYTLKKRRWL